MSDKFKSIDDHNFNSAMGYKEKKNLYEELNVEFDRKEKALPCDEEKLYEFDDKSSSYSYKDYIKYYNNLNQTEDHLIKGLYYDPIKYGFAKDEQKFTFNEDKYVNELLEYIRSTYTQHYAQGKYQATDLIFDKGYGKGFCIGNSIKYLCRFGKKDGYNRKDLLKALHYNIMALYIFDTEHLGE